MIAARKFLRVGVWGILLTAFAWNSVWAGQVGAKKKAAAGNAAEGKKLFERHCALCHGIGGQGGRGPALNRPHLLRAPDDAALKGVITDGIPPSMPEGWLFDEDDVANLAAFVRSLGRVRAEPVAGDPDRGAAVYVKSACGGCHVLNGQGGGFGPELTGIGDRRNAEYLRKTISKPAEALPEDFLFVRAATASGEKIEGIRVNEDSFTIQIKDLAGRHYSLRKDALSELKKLKGETPMPAFEGILSATDVQDLAAYLAAQRGKP